MYGLLPTALNDSLLVNIKETRWYFLPKVSIICETDIHSLGKEGQKMELSYLNKYFLID